MNIQLGEKYTINKKVYVCTDHHPQFVKLRSSEHDTEPETIIIHFGVVVYDEPTTPPPSK